jgi:Flp pilus assembly pilin Flp
VRLREKAQELPQRPLGGREASNSIKQQERRDIKVIDRLVVWALTLKVRARSERGQDIMEYAILTGGIAVALTVALAWLIGTGDGGRLSGFFGRLGDFVDTLVP